MKKSLESLKSEKFQLSDQELKMVSGGRVMPGTTTTVVTSSTSGSGLEDTATTTTTCENDPCVCG